MLEACVESRRKEPLVLSAHAMPCALRTEDDPVASVVDVVMTVPAFTVRFVIVVALIERSNAALSVDDVADVSPVIVFLFDRKPMIYLHIKLRTVAGLLRQNNLRHTFCTCSACIAFREFLRTSLLSETSCYDIHACQGQWTYGILSAFQARSCVRCNLYRFCSFFFLFFYSSFDATVMQAIVNAAKNQRDQ